MGASGIDASASAASSVQHARRGWLALALLLAALGAAVAPTQALAEGEGEPVQGKVVGGEDAPSGSWPSIVALVTASNGNAYAGQFCGGTLIRSGWVLTAAHCLQGSTAGSIDVVAGRRVLSSGAGERISSWALFTHPAYNSQSLVNDVALIQLARSSSQPTMSIADDGLWTAGTTAQVGGWGSMAPGFPDALQQAEVPIISDAGCTSSYGSAYDSATMLCAGYAEGGIDTCQGDSGGPITVSDGSGGYALVGATSWGTGCALAGYPGVYARVGQFVGWVNSTISNAKAPSIPTPTPSPAPASPSTTPLPAPAAIPVPPPPDADDADMLARCQRAESATKRAKGKFKRARKSERKARRLARSSGSRSAAKRARKATKRRKAARKSLKRRQGAERRACAELA